MAKKVLIVEDDGNIAELLHLYLEKEGFETQVARDGGKGVELFRSFQPDLVLLDTNFMPSWLSASARLFMSISTTLLLRAARADSDQRK